MDEAINVNLSPVWSGILNVYREFAKVCDQHHLRFYLTDGSAIGAVRHRGFIPWDDDLDVSMPREDFNRFLEIAKNELPSFLQVLSLDHTRGYPLSFAKVQDIRKEVVERLEKEVGFTLSSGLYIDIFPFDGWSGSRVRYCLAKTLAFFVGCIEKYRFAKYDKCTRRAKCAWIIGAILSPVVKRTDDEAALSLLYESCFGRRDTRGYPYTARIRCRKDRRLILRADIWGDPVMIDFCGIKAPIPHGYDEYLRQDYGDYMKLPPTEKRRSHHRIDGWHVNWWLGLNETITDRD